MIQTQRDESFLLWLTMTENYICLFIMFIYLLNHSFSTGTIMSEVLLMPGTSCTQCPKSLTYVHWNDFNVCSGVVCT